MEKSSVRQKRFRRHRLLVFAALLSGGISFAKAPSPGEIRQLKVTPDSKNIFTAQENGFTLEIPGLEPSKIQTDLPALPSGVLLVSSKREEVIFTSGERGTSVRMWFSFRDTGAVRLPPLILTVGRREYYIPFENFEVFENPALISPVLEIDFLSGVSIKNTRRGKEIETHAGDEIVFLLKLKYFVQIFQFEWELPENSIFKEIEKYEISRGVPAGTDFSPDALPVAKFSWKPLVAGDYTLPEIRISATSYNGSRKQVPLPFYQIKVLPPSGIADDFIYGQKSAGSPFKNAFVEEKDVAETGQRQAFSREDSEKLAELYSLERNFFPSDESAALRRELESVFGGTLEKKSVAKPAVFIFCLLAFLAGIAALIFFIFRKNSAGLLFLTVFGIFCVFSVQGIASLWGNYGIFAGGDISSVPEEVTTSVHRKDGGQKVRIVESAGDYYFIRSKEISGWVLKSCVFEID